MLNQKKRIASNSNSTNETLGSKVRTIFTELEVSLNLYEFPGYLEIGTVDTFKFSCQVIQNFTQKTHPIISLKKGKNGEDMLDIPKIVKSFIPWINEMSKDLNMKIETESHLYLSFFRAFQNLYDLAIFSKYDQTKLTTRDVDTYSNLLRNQRKNPR